MDRVVCWIDYNGVVLLIELLDLRMERFVFIKVVIVLLKEIKVGFGYRIDFSGDGVLRG